MYCSNKWIQVQVNVFICISICAVPVEGLKSQKYFDELRLTYINELDRLINYGRKTNCAMRFQQLTRLMDSLQPVSDTHTHTPAGPWAYSVKIRGGISSHTIWLSYGSWWYYNFACFAFSYTNSPAFFYWINYLVLRLWCTYTLYP